MKNQSYILIALAVAFLSGCSGGGASDGAPLPRVMSTPTTPSTPQTSSTPTILPTQTAVSATSTPTTLSAPKTTSTPATISTPTMLTSAIPSSMPTTTPVVPSSPPATPTPTPTSTLTISSISNLLQEGSAIPTSGGIQAFPNGDTSSGGQGATIDGIACNAGMSVNYHIHTHISILNGNVQAYLPQAVGLYQPAAATGTFPNTYQEVGICAYDLHMHDHSGIIHIESSTVPSRPYTLGQFFDIWGEPLTSTNVAGLAGPVKVYITATTADAKGIQQPTLTPQIWTGPLSSIPLIAHQEITIIIGNSSLPMPRYSWPANF